MQAHAIMPFDEAAADQFAHVRFDLREPVV